MGGCGSSSEYQGGGSKPRAPLGKKDPGLFPAKVIRNGKTMIHVDCSSQCPYIRGYNCWITPWGVITGQDKFETRCSDSSCREKSVTDGAHVKVRSKYYIVPTCASHNRGQNGKTAPIRDGVHALLITDPDCIRIIESCLGNT